MPARAALVLGLLAAVISAAPASAARLDRRQRRCERAAARAGRTFLGQSLAALGSCTGRVARGALPAGTDCGAEARARGRRDAAAVKLARAVTRACDDDVVAALRFQGECAGRRTAAGLVACLRDGHSGEAQALAALLAPAGGLSSAARRCLARAQAETRRFVLARLALLQRCKRRPPRRLLPGAGCAEEPRTAKRIGRLAARAVRRVAGACGAAVPGGLAGGCAASAGGTALGQCLVSAAEGAGDRVLAAEHRDPGFCGDAGPIVERRVTKLLRRMTLAEKLDQMHGSGLAGTWRTPDNDRLGVPGFGMIDGPRGLSTLTGQATTFPVGSARGATWDPALEEQVGEAVGAEARARGGSVLLAPTINILRHPRWGRAQETYGEDTLHLGRMGAAFVRGVQHHVIASAKHFAANSIENTRFSVDVTADERTLREVYLPHFRRAVEEGHAASVMSAYNKVNGSYCAENSHLLRDVLKGDWGFQGFVESDWVLGTRSTVASANAGLDIEMPVPNFYGDPLGAAVGSGQVPSAAVDEAARRALRTKLCFRLDTDPPALDPTAIESPAHGAVALQVAREALVLLRNVGSALPLDRTLVGSIVVVGELAAVANLGDRGSSRATPTSAVSPLDGIRALAGAATVTHLASAPLGGADLAAVAAADAAVVVVGLTYEDEGEGGITAGDRTSLVLPRDQDALVAAVAAQNPRTIVVLEGSGGVTMPWVDDVAAILMAWYPGQAGGTAIGEVLFGDVVPSGKLPVTFPRAESDLPEFFPSQLTVTYGLLHGYRWLDARGTEPLFPFGHGLSYTTFAYANLTVSPARLAPDGRLRVTADVTNTGARAGAEVVQLYVGLDASAVVRAPRELEAFTRVHLEQGETRTVTFDLPASELAYWNAAAGAWEVEPSAYRVWVGASSRDLPLEGTFTVAPDAPA